MNTASNSRPFAECTVISCSASCPAPAWLSPASSDACARNASSGDAYAGSATPASITSRSPSFGSTSTAPSVCSSARGGAIDVGIAFARASSAKPSSPEKLAAALTSSFRFSMRSAPSFSDS